jgi:hypothetical protein
VWVPADAARKGSVVFFDASGNQLAAGSNINAIGQVGSSFGYLGTRGAAPRAGATTVLASLAAPDPAVSPASSFPSVALTPSAFTWSPTPSGTPAFTPLTPAAFLHLDAAGAAFQTRVAGLPLYSGTDPDYLHVLEVRLADAGPSLSPDGTYWATDIEYNPSTATSAYDGLAPGAWRVVYPALVIPTPILTTPTVSPSAPMVVGTALHFTTTIRPQTGTLTGGRIRFFTGAATINGALAVTGTCTPSAPCSVTSSAVSDLNVGTTAVYAQYFNAAGILVDGATSPSVNVTVTKPPAVATTVTLGVIQSSSPTDLPGTVTQPALITGSAAVTITAPGTTLDGSPVDRGSVSYYADGSSTPFAVALDPVMSFDFSVPSTVFAGSPDGLPHTIVAKYDGSTSTTAADYLPSTSATGTIAVINLVISTDPQGVQTQIDPGTVTITTPYTNTSSAPCPTDAVTGLPTSPSTCGKLVLPPMTLDSTATGYTTAAAFDNIAVLDSRPGNLPYDVYAQASPLTRGPSGSGAFGTVSTIDSHDVGLTAVALSTLPGEVNNTVMPAGAPEATNNTIFQNLAADWVQPAAVVFPNSHVGVGGSGQRVLHVNYGLGTTTLDGILTVHAPSNTQDGMYTGTITFSAFSSGRY